jgi:hypothetical protein
MRSQNLAILFIAWSLLLAGGHGQAPVTQADPLEIRLRSVPLDLEKVPLTRALSTLALSMDKEFVLFGTEIVTERGQDPLFRLMSQVDPLLKKPLKKCWQQIRNIHSR